MAQSVDVIVYEFGTVDLLDFNYKLYKRDSSKSYRPSEKTGIPFNLGILPNSPPVDVDHTFVESMTDVTSPHTLSLDEDEDYYITIWKDCYIQEWRRFYVAAPDAVNIFSFPNDIYFELRKMQASNASIFV